jgi:hypothetical protein
VTVLTFPFVGRERTIESEGMANFGEMEEIDRDPVLEFGDFTRAAEI